MDFSVREEILISGLIFGFCIISIPIVLMNSGRHRDLKHHRTFLELTMKERALIESISILEDLNRQRNVSSAGISDILDETDEKFFKKYEDKLGHNFTFKVPKKQMRNVWSKFKLMNGTILKSPTLRLPLKVDW